MERTFSSKAYLDMELLRFTTAGSVDDGKSTLIGRLLFSPCRYVRFFYSFLAVSHSVE